MAKKHIKFWSLLLALVMVMSLLPMSALAAEGDPTPEVTVRNNDSTGVSKDGITATKTIEQVAGSTNKFAITLKAVVDGNTEETTTKNPAHVVLVIDRSGSMGNSGAIADARTAAKGFVDTFFGDKASDGNMLAVVSYNKEATTVSNMVDKTSKDTVKTAIDGISVDEYYGYTGGTNTQAGIRSAQSILTENKEENVKNIIVLLSDGQPTYSYQFTGTATWTGCDKYGGWYNNKHEWNDSPWYDNEDGNIKDGTINVTGSSNIIVGSGSSYKLNNNLALTVTCEHGETTQKYVSWNGSEIVNDTDNGVATKWEAEQAKTAGTEIFSILLMDTKNDEYTNANAVMSALATQDGQHYKNASQASELGEIFNDVANSTTSYIALKNVTDPMPSYVKFDSSSITSDASASFSDKTLTWNLSEAGPVESTNEAGNKIKTYTLTYNITVNPGTDLYDAIISGTGSAPTNGTTMLTYGDSGSLNFNVPTVTCALPDYNVTYSWTGEPTGEGYVQTIPTGASDVKYGRTFTVDKTFTSGTAVNHKDAYGNVDGKWTFSGWNKSGDLTVTDDVTITGSWTYKDVTPTKYTITYKWDASAPTGVYAQDVPTDSTEYVNNQPYTVSHIFDGKAVNKLDAYGNIIGTWTFSSWDKTDGNISDNLDITGSWTYKDVTPTKYTVTYTVDGNTVGAVEEYVNNQPVTIRDKYVKSGYTVTDWSVPAGLAVSGGKFNMPSDNVIITATSTANPIIIPINPPVDIPDEDVPKDLNSTDHYVYILGYPDGTVQPNGNITRAEVTTAFYRLLTTETRDSIFTSSKAPYSDIAVSQWFNKAIASMSTGKYVMGYPDGSFGANKNITRAEFVAIAARFMNAKDGTVTFSDVSTTNWAYQYISTAVSYGWIEGYEDGTFRPNQPITRAEAMTIINRMLNRGVDANGLMEGFKDWPDNVKNAWYYFDVLEATNDHEYTGARPVEQWTSLTSSYTYDIVKYERP